MSAAAWPSGAGLGHAGHLLFQLPLDLDPLHLDAAQVLLQLPRQRVTHPVADVRVVAHPLQSVLQLVAGRVGVIAQRPPGLVDGVTHDLRHALVLDRLTLPRLLEDVGGVLRRSDGVDHAAGLGLLLLAGQLEDAPLHALGSAASAFLTTRKTVSVSLPRACSWSWSRVTAPLRSLRTTSRPALISTSSGSS